MAGRKLQRQREAGLAALSDTEAVELARTLVPRFPSGIVRTLIVTSPGDWRSVLNACGSDRAALLAIVASDPTTARLAISMRWHDAEVETALGITRTPAQQRR